MSGVIGVSGVSRLRLVVAAAVAAVLCGSTGVASAREYRKEPSSLSKTQQTKQEKQLARRVGKKPDPVINLWNSKTHEWLVLPADEKAMLDQTTANEYFRCTFTNQPTRMDLRLLKVLAKTALHFKSDRIIVVSAYRARKYNLMLRKKGREVARDSQHSEGNAVDFMIPGVPVKTLREFVKSLRAGGVGFYPESGFVHADTGRIRYWVGR